MHGGTRAGGRLGHRRDVGLLAANVFTVALAFAFAFGR
jgi:hypothetical protein